MSYLSLIFFAATSILFFFKTPLLWSRLNCPIQVQQGEGINVEKGLLLSKGESLYPDAAQEAPYLYTPYPPLYFWAESFLQKDFANPWLAGRLLAFIGYIGLGLLLAGWFWGRAGLFWGCCSAFLFWSLPDWGQWATVDRLDTLFIFFNFASFLLLYRSELNDEKTVTRPVIAAGLLQAVALAIKQTSLTLTLSYLVYCLIRRNWRKAAAFLGTSFVPFGILMLWQNEASHGLFLLHNFVWLNLGYHWPLLAQWLMGSFWHNNAWIVLTVLVGWFFRRAPLFLNIQMIFITLELFSLGREGSAANYWLGFSLYGLFFIAENLRFVGHFFPTTDKKMLWTGVLLWMGLAVGSCQAVFDKSLSVPDEMEVKAKQDAKKFFAPGEDLALDMDLLVMAGQKIWVQPYEYTLMVNRGYWPVEPLLRDIRARKFKTIELYDLPDQYLLPEVVVEVIRENYHLNIKRYGRVWLSPNAT